MDLKRYSHQLQLRLDGMWTVPAEQGVSYPTSGHQDCFEIEDSSFWFQHRNDCLAGLVDRYPPSGPIFDIGGGNGVVAAALKARGWPVVLVEPGEVGCRNARARGIQDVIQATFEGADFDNEVLPAVGLFDVIEHVADDAAFLRSVGSKLAPDGVIYATVPAFRWLWSVDDEKAGHFRRYTRSGVINTFRAAGFRTTYASYMFAPLPFGILLLRSLPSRLRLLRDVSADRTAREHQSGGLIERVITLILRLEQRRLPHGRIPFGSSIVVVADRRELHAERP
jgi:SAM-dependent methyltransferase